MNTRELQVLGTSGQGPTRFRNPNGYLMRWDHHGLLFDPGEGTLRQLVLASVPITQVTHIFITHFHGDHCLGLPSIIQRIALERTSPCVELFYPASGQQLLDSLLNSCGADVAVIIPRPLPLEISSNQAGGLDILAAPLEHTIDTLGYRLSEPDEIRFLPEYVQREGLQEEHLDELSKAGSVEFNGKTIFANQISERRPGAVFAFIMDTRPTAACQELAQGADLLVCESTFLNAQAAIAHAQFHMTPEQAANLALQASVKQLLLTHFSYRHSEANAFLHEARSVFGSTEVARDLTRCGFGRPSYIRPDPLESAGDHS
jgi:ribonuclease Z